MSGVINIEEVKNPIQVAQVLLNYDDKVLGGSGATHFARQHGFEKFSTEIPQRRKEYEEKLASKIEILEKYAFGENIIKRVELYTKYLSVNDSKYLSWAIKEMVCWEQKEVIPDITHIHGDKDPVFPIKYIKNCIVVKNGSHIAIINKYKWFNENLPKLLLGS